ncbi:IPT/TIG domain-containing protein [Nocardia vinacea]|uniref:IPT/TIG domain-containing protein n=1 Tax=Nocardia vinacea TaxID=96468 RepID=UPI003429679E
MSSRIGDETRCGAGLEATRAVLCPNGCDVARDHDYRTQGRVEVGAPNGSLQIFDRRRDVTITGAGFTGPTTVRFGTTATTFTLDSSTPITAIAPAGAAGTVQITAMTAGGTSNGIAFTYF